MHTRTLLILGPVLLALGGCAEDKEDGTLDADGDGYDVNDDCDDGDADVNPGADELCDDGIDNNCDGVDDTCILDADGDGVAAEDDCDDQDASVYPGAVEDCYDGRDNDCNGVVTECIDPVMTYEELGLGAPGTYSTAIAADQILFGDYQGNGTARFFEFDAGVVAEADAITTTDGETAGSTFGVGFSHPGGDLLCIHADYFSTPAYAAGKSYCFSEATLRAEVGTLIPAHAEFTVTGEVDDAYTTVEAIRDLDGDGFDDVLAYTARGVHVIQGDGTGFSGDYSVPTDAGISLGACDPASSIWCGYGRAALLDDPGAILIAGDGSTDTTSWFDLPLIGSSPSPDATYTISRADPANAAAMPTLSGFAIGDPAEGDVTLIDAGGSMTVLNEPAGNDFGYWVATGQSQTGAPLLLASAVDENEGTIYVFDLDLTPLPTSTDEARYILMPPGQLDNCGWRTDVGVVADDSGTHTLVSSACLETGGAVYELDFQIAPPPPLPASAVTQIGPKRYEIRQQAVDLYTSRVEWAQSLAQTEAVPGGWRLHAIGSGSPLDRMGLQNGDIVHGVNEHPISTPAQVRAAAQNLMSATTLLLDIVRGGTSGTIRYDIVP